MGVQSITSTSAADWNTTSTDDGAIVTVRQGEDLTQVADRLGVSKDDLLQANPQLANLDKLSVGMELRIPLRESSGRPDDDAAVPPAVNRPETRIDGSAMRAVIDSMTRRRAAEAADTTPTGSPADAAGATDASPDDRQRTDPRFDAVNQALQAGNGEEAAAAAQQLITTLQAEKPPQTKLLNEARMSLAAASILKGDFDSATGALSAVNPKKLDEGDGGNFEALCGLVKDGRRAAFSGAVAQATDDGANVKDQTKAAAAEAGKLAAFLQKTDPTNTAEISEAKLKQANALLVGGNYREAEKVLNGVNEKTLDADQKEYLNALRDQLHGQQIQALAGSCQAQMKRKNYDGAVSDAKALVNDLVKYSPDDKDRAVAGRMQLATAQIMKGDMEDARKTLARVPSEDLKNMPDGIQKRFQALDGAVKEHFENVKKEKALQDEQEAVKGQLKTIKDLASSGDKASVQKAVALAEKLVADTAQKHPEALDAAKLTLADTKLMAGDTQGAKADLEKLVAETSSQEIKDEARLLQGRAELKENRLGAGLKILQDLSENGSTPDVQKAAKRAVIAVEASYLHTVDQKATLERDNLHKIDEEKSDHWIGGQFFNMPSQPETAMMRMKQDDNTLRTTAEGAALMGGLMKGKGLTVADFQKMSHADLVKLTGEGNLQEIEAALANSDVKLIGKHDLQGGDLSWQNNSLYCDLKYLDSSLDKVGQWVGDRVRGARNMDEELKASDSLAAQALGYASAFVMDRVSDANGFVKDKLKTAADFYNDPERRDTWYAKIGRAGTTAGDILASTFTMPATVVDYKADDKERTGAIVGTVAMAATAGLIKGGGPAWRTASNYAGRASARIAASDAAQWIAKSEFGQIAGKGLAYASRGASKVAGAVRKGDAAIEDSSFGKAMDKVKSTVNPTLFPKKVAPTKTVDEVVDAYLEGKTPAEIREVTPAEIQAKRSEIRNYGRNPNNYTADELKRMVIGDRIYWDHYNPVGEPKPYSITQSDFKRQYQRYQGPVDNSGSWHRRYNEPGPGEAPATEETPEWLKGEVRRVYFNVQPDRAAELADYLSTELNTRSMKFQFKMPKDVSKFNRADSGVLYVPEEDYGRVKEIVQRYAKDHPDAFAEGSPAFTKPISKGVAVADEPIQQGLPRTGTGSHSFGSARADIAADAILKAPADATKEEIRQLVRQELKRYGFDPDRPWLKQNETVDGL